jgi:hypothetical protein
MSVRFLDHDFLVDKGSLGLMMLGSDGVLTRVVGKLAIDSQ